MTPVDTATRERWGREDTAIAPPIIGLHGRAKAGKDTGCEVIIEWAGARGVLAAREAFADRLKQSAAAALGFEGDREACVAYCNDLKVNGIIITDLADGRNNQQSGREFLQLYGTEAHRDVFGKDFWLAAVYDSPTARDAELLVITDVRFPNEIESVQQRGGEVWYIDRDVAGAGDHASEKVYPELCDRTIPNNASLTEYEYQLCTALAEVRKAVAA